MFWRVSLSMLIAMLFAGNVAAQVQVTSVDQDFENGNIVTISGLGFGFKATARPWNWDDLTSSAYSSLGDDDVFPTRDGDNLHPQDANAPQKDADYSSTALPAVIEKGTTRAPGRSVYRIRNPGGSAIKEMGDVGGDFMMVDWWIRSSEIMSGNTSEVKIGRFWAGSSGVIGRLTIYPTRMKWDAYPDETTRYGSWMTDGEWNHYTIMLDSSGGLGPGAGNGTVKFYWNNKMVVSGDDMTWTVGRETGVNYTWAEMIGAVDYNQTNSHVGETLISDIYMDNTQSRVALGDAANWSDVTHFELQIPQDWQSDSIQVAGNLGSFGVSEALWLFVFDSDGNVNQTGLAVGTNHGDPVETPGQPGQPVLVGS